MPVHRRNKDKLLRIENIRCIFYGNAHATRDDVEQLVCIVPFKFTFVPAVVVVMVKFAYFGGFHFGG